MVDKEKRVELKENLVMEIEDLQAVLRVGAPNMDFDCLTWLNNVCSKLTCICKFVHTFIITENKLRRNVVEVIFLCLRQLICCINYLERTLKMERRILTSLKLCREHFLERMSWCLQRLTDAITVEDDPSTVGSKFKPMEFETNFVVYMDEVLNLIAPLSLYPSYDMVSTNRSVISDETKAPEITESDFLQASREIRTIVELLIGQALAFVAVASDDDKGSLTTLCHCVMKACIGFQEICLAATVNDLDKKHIIVTESDKRLKAQQLQNTLYNLDKFVNDCLLRVFFDVFSDLNENVVDKLRSIKAKCDSLPAKDKSAIDREIENFDNTLDRIIQIGTFAAAYAFNVKDQTPLVSCYPKSKVKKQVKSNLQSCLASCEALGSFLIPSILSSGVERDSEILEHHWNDSIKCFRKCAQEVIDTHAFCLILIDTMNDIVHKLNNRFDKEKLKSVLLHCDVLQEHIQYNYNELGLNVESALKLFYEDFKVMVKECKASIRPSARQIDPTRIKKRFSILLSVMNNIEKLLNSKQNKDSATAMGFTGNDENNIDKPFIFGNVTLPSDSSDINFNDDTFTVVGKTANRMTESMEVAVDLNEFISKNETVKHELTHRNSIFYDTLRKRNQSLTFGQNSQNAKSIGGLKKDILSSKRASKRRSLRVAMFKRQKSLETQKFLDNCASPHSHAPEDTLNLQITDILEQLSTTSVCSEDLLQLTQKE